MCKKSQPHAALILYNLAKHYFNCRKVRDELCALSYTKYIDKYKQHFTYLFNLLIQHSKKLLLTL